MVRNIKVESIKGNEEIIIDGFISIRTANNPSNVTAKERQDKLNKMKSDIEKLVLDYLENQK